jgi:type I restriction enzyme S subunit
MIWRRVRIAEIATVKGGKRLPKGCELVKDITPHPYIRGQDIRGGKITFDDPVFVTETTHKKIQRYTVTEGDVCITIVGNIGDVGITPKSLSGANLTENAVKLVDLRNSCDRTFLAYALLNPDAQSQMKLSAAGAAQPKLGIYKVNEITIPLPPVNLQRRIAGILSAYDDLIENNQRRIKILEEMARSLYREWFVNFRFPGHEKVPLVDSPLGKIPQGWEGSFAAEVDFKEGPGLRNWQYRDCGIPFLNIRTLVDNDIDLSKVQFLDEDEVENRYQHFLLKEYDHVVSSSGTIGRIVTIRSDHLPLMLNTSTIRMRPKSDRIGRWLLKHFLLSDYFQNQARSFATGAAQPNFGPVHLKQMTILVPPKIIASEYERKVEAMELSILAFARKKNLLRRTRDLLLPRLLSGAVSFDDVQPEAITVDSASHPLNGQSQSGLPSSARALSENGDRITAPAKMANRQPPGADNGSDGRDETPPPISDTDRTEVLAAIRQVFSDGECRERESAIREIAHALGYGRTGHVIEEVLNTDLLTAVRRGILENLRGELKLRTRSIEDYERDFLKEQFLAAIGRTWIEREDAIREFARWLGFARTGSVIDEVARSLIKGLLREERIEADGPNLIRRL